MARAAFRQDWLRAGLIQKLVTELNMGTQPSEKGGIQLIAPDHNDLFFLLADCITFPKKLTRKDIAGISRRAFLDLRKTGHVELKPLISAIADRVAKLQSAPMKKFTMWTKCRLTHMTSTVGCHFEFAGIKMRTVGRLPKWLQLEPHFISGIGDIDPNLLPKFGYIILTTEARNENDASTKMFMALETLFAVINTTWRSISLWIQRTSSAKIWSGPNFFFFDGREFTGESHAWYNPQFVESDWNRFAPSARDFRKLLGKYKETLRILEAHPLRDQLRTALVQISDGMISKDLAYRVMRFCSAADALYAPPSERTSVSKIQARLLFASVEDRWLETLKLERVYQLRNSYVHEGSTESDDSSLVQSFRELLLQHIYYLIYNGDDIENQQDLLAMIDLPSETKALERRREAINRRLAIIREGRHRPA